MTSPTSASIPAIDLALRDRAVYLPAVETLVLADLHLGRDATSEVSLPLGERADVTERLRALLERCSPATVVFAGDVLHSFSGVPGDAAETFDALVRAVSNAGAEAVVTPGNHDAMLEGIWRGRTVPEHRIDVGTATDGTRDGTDGDPPGEPEGDGSDEKPEGGPGDSEARTPDRVLVCHGHRVPEGSADLYVVGHDHPAIEIEGRRRPCYLYGSGVYREADVLMVPAFNRLTAGVTVNGMRARDFQSPLVADADAFRPVVRDEESDETLWFPPLGEFRSLL